jgi:hypothetical protein
MVRRPGTTEAEWLASSSVEEMMDVLVDLARSRRQPFPHRAFRLFACACCRRVWHLLGDERSRAAVGVSEQYADGRATRSAQGRAFRAAEEVVGTLKSSGRGNRAPYLAATMAMWAAADSIQDAVGFTSETSEALAGHLAQKAGQLRAAARAAEERRQCDLLRCLAGNPFRPPPALDPTWLAWNDRAVPRLAQTIYEECTFDRLPVLADALEEAGCTDAQVLEHARRPGEHARGCWVVDWVLEKK